MTMLASQSLPQRMMIPHVAPFIGETPEDRHAERIIGVMLDFLDKVTAQVGQQLTQEKLGQIGGSVKSQQRFAERVRNSRSPAIIQFSPNYGSRCRFKLGWAIYERDAYGGAVVSWLLVKGEGPGRVSHGSAPLWRVSRHALARMVQRCEAHDAFALLYRMRELADEVSSAVTERLLAGDKTTLRVPFAHGIAVVEWPSDSPVAVVKTVLPLGARQ